MERESLLTMPAIHTPASPDAAGLYTRSGLRKYLNTEERRRLLIAVESLPADQALFTLTLAWTGARVSEVLALCPASFQIQSGLVSIRTLKRRAHRMREVPIPPALMLALDRHFGLEAAQCDVSCDRRHLWPWCRQTGWRIIKRVMTPAGIHGRSASPRGLRHAFGVGSLQAGVPLNIVQRWLGHSRISTTAIYAAASGLEELALAKRFWRFASGCDVPPG